MKFETKTPKAQKEQVAMDYALWEMATSYFKKVEYEGGVLKDRMVLGWAENSKKSQFAAEDKVLAMLDKSPLSNPAYDIENKVAKAKVIKSKDGTHYALRLTGKDFFYELEVFPIINKKTGFPTYKLAFRDLEEF